MECPHVSNICFASINATTEFYKEECYYCFDNQDSSDGVDLCLTCLFLGCKPGPTHNDQKACHSLMHFDKNPGHHISLNIRRTKLSPPSGRHSENQPPSPKMTKLAIPGEESEEEKYQIHYQPHCLTCTKDLSPESNPKLADIIRNIETASSATHKSNVQAWEETRTSCEHVICAEQFPDLKPVSNEVRCEGCDLQNNLWLCFTCGALGCGRRQYDGSGGNGHGLAHFQNTGHKVSVKLGTITPEGDADVYCYVCDDERVDPELKVHLSKLGIHIHDQVKTEKSVTELQIEHNLLFDFNMTTEDGKQLTPLGGPGLTGLKNLGNSCYMASVVQALFALSSFKERYLASADLHHLMCQENPLDCFHCQASKLAYGLYSGRYSQVQDEHQDGIPPTMFKRLVGKGHHEFSTMQQQDAFEYAGHLLSIMERYEKASGLSPTMANFQFKQEHRLECQGCTRARYSSDITHTLSLPVPVDQSVSLEDCFAKFFEPELVEGYNCPQCKVPTVAVKTTRFLTYPKVLILNLRQFALVNWVPTKLEIPVAMPSDGNLTPLLEKYRAPRRADGELLLPDQPESHHQEVNQDLVNQMMSMGLSQAQCQRALRATGGSDVDAAVSWVFEHMDDPDVDELPASSIGPDPESIAMLVSMGFSEAHATQALKSTDSNMERAVEWIFSHPEGSTSDQPPSTDAGVEDLNASYFLKAFVSHKGTSTHCGHYVAHVNVPDQSAWVLFNDNKVAAQPEPPVENAYLYFFQRQEEM